MKRNHWLANFTVMISTFLVSQTALADAGVKQFDGRAWTIGNRQQSSKQILTEYVLPGQTVDNWKELVTSTVFVDPEHAVPLAKFVDRIHTSMAAGCPSLVWNVVRQDEKMMIFEWHDSGCGGFAPQAEIDRVATGTQGVYRLAYAAYVDGAFPVTKRNAWLQILGRVPLVEAPAESATAAATASSRPISAHANEIETAALAREIDKSGQTCAAGVSSERLPAQNGLKKWNVECSGGHKYIVLLDPSGAVTVMQAGSK